jgi:hypothetical protein
MYDLINANLGIVLQAIDPIKTVDNYVSLLQSLSQVATLQFQNKYTSYWGMQYPNQAYRSIYFQTLETALLTPLNPPNLNNLATTLYSTPANRKGQSNQFSFVTKLLHMVDRHSPIFDRNVAAFYFFREPNDPQKRNAAYLGFHAFLVKEYGRVLQNGLLCHPMQAFRQRFAQQQQHFTDERVIDVLIWTYAGLLRKGALINGQVMYR